jgi:hypothetical protein
VWKILWIRCALSAWENVPTDSLKKNRFLHMKCARNVLFFSLVSDPEVSRIEIVPRGKSNEPNPEAATSSWKDTLSDFGREARKPTRGEAEASLLR